jgi:hypothetical protein
MGLALALSYFNKLLKKSENMDPNTGRLSLIEKKVRGAISPYKQIYDEERYKPIKPPWACF